MHFSSVHLTVNERICYMERRVLNFMIQIIAISPSLAHPPSPSFYSIYLFVFPISLSSSHPPVYYHYNTHLINPFQRSRMPSTKHLWYVSSIDLDNILEHVEHSKNTSLHIPAILLSSLDRPRVHLYINKVSLVSLISGKPPLRCYALSFMESNLC